MNYEKTYGGLGGRSQKLLIVLLLPLVLCVASCRTQKTTTLEQTNKQTDETETIDEQHDSTANSTTEIDVAETNVQDEAVEQIVEIIEWSAPDTLGNQYVVKTVRTATNIQRGTRNDKQSTMSNTTDSYSTTATHTRRTKSEETETKMYHSEQNKIKTPGWVHTAILGILAVILIVVLIILKRYHIL